MKAVESTSRVTLTGSTRQEISKFLVKTFFGKYTRGTRHSERQREHTHTHTHTSTHTSTHTMLAFLFLSLLYLLR